MARAPLAQNNTHVHAHPHPQSYTHVNTDTHAPPSPPPQVQQLDALSARVAQAAARAESRDEALADPPEEFMDPLFYTLMTDPVISPASGTVFDRAVIRRHLLSDPRDPVNRQPLEARDLKPAAELKARIDAWVAEQRAKAGGGGKGGAGGAAAMETG